MAIKMIPVTCPRCNASIDVDANRDYCFCTYCGTKILMEDDSIKTINLNYHYTKTDEAKIEKTKSNERIRLRELQSMDAEKKWVGIAYLAIMAILFIYLATYHYIEDRRQTQQLEQLSQEIVVDIQNGNYSEARLKANQIHYTADSSEKKKKWDEVRKSILKEISEAENGGVESFGDMLNRIFD